MSVVADGANDTLPHYSIEVLASPGENVAEDLFFGKNNLERRGGKTDALVCIKMKHVFNFDTLKIKQANLGSCLSENPDPPSTLRNRQIARPKGGV